MRAILLAAGRGRRLGSDLPKCLLSIEGKTLLERHIRCLLESGVSALTIVVGYRKEAIFEATSELHLPLAIEFVENPRFSHGSIVSLWVAADRLADGGIWMDADVLYPTALLRRLVTSKHDNCVLLDGRSEESGEEMMIGTRAGRALRLARRVGKEWDFVGESVGFFKVGLDGGRAMKRVLDEEVGAERIDQEYEAALDRAFEVVPFGYERVDDFAWTEIDFEEDVVKARELARSLF
jgi:choline kinase